MNKNSQEKIDRERHAQVPPCALHTDPAPPSTSGPSSLSDGPVVPSGGQMMVMVDDCKQQDGDGVADRAIQELFKHGRHTFVGPLPSYGDPNGTGLSFQTICDIPEDIRQNCDCTVFLSPEVLAKRRQYQNLRREMHHLWFQGISSFDAFDAALTSVTAASASLVSGTTGVLDTTTVPDTPPAPQ